MKVIKPTTSIINGLISQDRGLLCAVLEWENGSSWRNYCASLYVAQLSWTEIIVTVSDYNGAMAVYTYELLGQMFPVALKLTFTSTNLVFVCSCTTTKWYSVKMC